jgi:hypothetical protein
MWLLVISFASAALIVTFREKFVARQVVKQLLREQSPVDIITFAKDSHVSLFEIRLLISNELGDGRLAGQINEGFTHFIPKSFVERIESR